MLSKKIIRKAKIAHNLFIEGGVLAVVKRSINYSKKHTKKIIYKNKQRICTVARYDDIINAQFPIQTQDLNKIYGKTMSFAWIMPPPGKGSGGHLNIFRFIKYLEKAGHKCSIYLYVDSKHGTIQAVKDTMGESYPIIKASKTMKWLDNPKSLDIFDGIFATSWETAYASSSSRSTARRFYFIQDFEPYFYPVGGISTLAENTYKMGFYGITAGKWLSKKLSSEYGMNTDSFDFGSDSRTYKFTNHGDRKEIFYYARPYTSRRGFEIGILTLDLFHRKHPDYIINLVGWDVSEYSINFPYKNLKILEISELSELYNKCVAGLILSYTNMSLLPLELLRCGTIPVINDGENNRLVSDNPYIAFTQNDPHSLAEKLSEIVERTDKNKFAQEASEAVNGLSWNISGKKFVNIVEREMRKNE